MTTYTVFYMKPDSFRRFNFGQEFPAVTDLREGYEIVRTANADGMEDLFHMMQGEIWSPNGEQREHIQRLGLSHTSMSVGDVVLDHTTGVFFVVAPIGFKEIN